MIHISRPIPKGAIVVRIECDGCRGFDQELGGVICYDPLRVLFAACGLRIKAYDRGWRRRRIIDPETGRPVRADLCAGCRSARKPGKP